MSQELLKIDAGADTPMFVVSTQPPHLLLKGDAMPEDASAFFEPVEKKMMELLSRHQGELVFEIELSYLNSMSGKQILKIVKRLSSTFRQFVLIWKYAPDDDLIRIKGEDFQRVCPTTQIRLLQTAV